MTRPRTDRQIRPRARCYVNGFPKSGLHLAALMVAALLKPQAENNWFGTLAKGWTNEPIQLDLAEGVLKKIGAGRFFKGHMHHAPELERLFYGYGVAMAFVYRDLRDVAVSQTHHIMTQEYDDEGKERFIHPGRDKFLALGGFDEILLAVVEGLDEYPGVIERWEVFAPWLEVDWVFPCPFEEMRYYPANIANRFLAYLVRMSLKAGGANESEADARAYPPGVFAQNVVHMVQTMRRTELSATFRKGKSGSWRKEFTPAAKAAFKERDNGWLVRLGYAKDENW